MRSVGQNITFSGHGHVEYKIKENHECNNMVANILPADPYTPPPPTLGMRSVGQNITFSGHGHVEYKIKENQECNNMVACRPRPPTLIMGLGISRSKFNFFMAWTCCISN